MKEQAVTTSSPQSTFTHKIGKSNYIVDVHFSNTSKETLQDKIERLIISDITNSKK